MAMAVSTRGRLTLLVKAQREADTADQGLVTLVFGLLAFGLMPAGPTQTASWFRGKEGWFTPK